MFMIKRFSMRVIQFQFYLLIWSQTAETITDRLTDLGQNVTINCDLHEEEVYWFLLKLTGPPVMILRTFSSPFYYNERFTNKYSVESKHHLSINNVTHDELGVYYCMSPETTSKELSNGTRLHINDTISWKNVDGKKQTQWLVIMSALMNGVLLIVVIGEPGKTQKQVQTTYNSHKIQTKHSTLRCIFPHNPVVPHHASPSISTAPMHLYSCPSHKTVNICFIH
ncbi:uncharacterized protein LOC130549116 isoform X2 [Triplophysa rosa]|uniref:uncharacterized protein LOC130549116 isoform X2 n=1 Tax=Triplophysa rosa TaxID=992332 RepID=UPI0025463907|nr:uncharacterized protein LOC130549116 isoform X2 [Triplophysa rosa]